MILGGILSFIGSPVGKWVGVAVAAVAFVAWQRHDAAQDARARAAEECRIEVQERTEEELSRQRKIAKTVLEEARKRQAITEAELAKLQERADELLAELPSAGGACLLDSDTVQRLLDIR